MTFSPENIDMELGVFRDYDRRLVPIIFGGPGGSGDGDSEGTAVLRDIAIALLTTFMLCMGGLN